VEESVREARTEFQQAIAQHVTAQVFEARMETVMTRVQAAERKADDNEARIQRAEDERDRVRLGLFLAAFTAFIGPILTAVLLGRVG
jgi:hypothetical protein